MSFGVFFVWYFGGRQILGGELTLGELMAFISYLWMLYRPLRWFGDFYNFMIRAYAGAERIFEIMDAPSEPFDNPDAVPMPKIEGRVTFKDAAFGYDPGKPVLKENNLYRFLINTLLIIYSLAEATEVATTGKTH